MPTLRLPALMCTILLIASPLQAQKYATDRGTWQVGGTARMTSFRDIGNDVRTFILNLNPRVGLFVLPGLLATANVQLQHSSAAAGHSLTLGFGPGLTFYLGRGQRRFYPFVSARTLATRTTSTTRISFPGPGGTTFADTLQSTDRTFTWLTSVGGALMLARNVAVTGECFYAHEDIRVRFDGNEQSNGDEEFGLQFGLSFFVF